MSLAVYNKLLSDLAERCGVRDPKTLRKSRELIGLLNSKCSINCSETCKVLICLELAAISTSVSLCREMVIKLAGCSKRNYVNNFNNISKLLNLDKIYTIKEICLLVGVSQISEVSLSLFKKYQAASTLEPSALEHPMYSCAAILAVSDEEKHPVNLQRLVDISRIKKTDLKKLSQEFSKLLEKKSIAVAKKDEEEKVPSKKDIIQRNDYTRDRTEEVSDEKYLDWKRRMLAED